MEALLLHGRHHFLAEHEVGHIRLGEDDPLLPGESLRPADLEEAFDLEVDPAHGLNHPLLVHRTRDGDPLVQGQVRQRRDDGEHLRGRRRVAVDSGIGLLEGH